MLKFLADVNIEKDLVELLKNLGNDVLWIPDYDCRQTDDELLELANKEKRILITNDTDFGEIVFLQKKISVGIILIRVKGQKVKTKLRVLRKLMSLYQNQLKNNFIVVSDRRIRIRPLEEKI